MADPAGRPVFTGGFEEFVIQAEAGEWPALLFLPDRKNDVLQRESKAPSATTFSTGCGSPATPPTTPVTYGASTSLASSAKPRPPLWARQEEGAYG